MLFKNRQDAGRQLVPLLQKYREQEGMIVLGLARGGVITAAEIAQALGLPLDVLVVRKIGAPGNEELALGAISEQGEGVFNDHLIGLLGVTSDYIKKEVERQRKIIRERLVLYRGQTKTLELNKKKVILVDDGIATGASVRVAIRAIKEAGAKSIILAVPVAAPESLQKIAKEVDEVVCLLSPPYFEAVGSFYQDFDQVTDPEIVDLLLN